MKPESPKSHDASHPSLGYRIALFVEGGAYLVAALLGLDWLIEKLLGRAGPPDEVQRAGLWILGALGLCLVVLFFRRRRQDARE